VVGTGSSQHHQRLELRPVPIIHAILLGLVQGLSEFLPISSSGHLLLVPWLFNWHDFDNKAIEKAFDVTLHIGTLVAVVAYFRRDLVVYVREGIKAAMHRDQPASPEGKLAWLLVVSSIPAAIVGALFEKTIDNRLGKPWIIAVSLIVFGVLLGLSDRRAGRRELPDYERGDALQIGAAQVLALNPGTSRSGITITAARYLGFTRDTAARASFLMAIPVTAGAIAYKMLKLAKDGVPHGLMLPMIVGIVTSAIAGWAAVWGTLRLIRTRSFMPFVVYRCALGVAVLIIVATNWR
jgi:undecaprenyl-diphosphatase